MRVLMASMFTCSALALLSAGCGDSAKKQDGPEKQAAIAPSPDEVVLNVPGMT